MLPNQMLTPDSLQRFMHLQGIAGELLFLKEPTPTVETAAKAAGTHPDRIVKSILFLVNQQPVLTISSGLARIDMRRLACYYQVGVIKIKLASPDTVLQLSGFQVGALPPFGHLKPLPTLLDSQVLLYSEVFAGGGADNVLLRLSPSEILRVTQAKVIELTTGKE